MLRYTKDENTGLLQLPKVSPVPLKQNTKKMELKKVKANVPKYQKYKIVKTCYHTEPLPTHAYITVVPLSTSREGN